MKGPKPVQKEVGEAWRYETLGYTFAFSVIVFAGAGFLLDRVFKTTPIFTVAGTLVGAGLAFVWVYQKVKADEARFKAERKPPPPEGKE
ncbi:MAG TPA: AtpZ/AtpI family protein [Gemmatimonadales bacterium]|nr:AtpZ/AtpI family protein [Gemmatimonadales bacterium]